MMVPFRVHLCTGLPRKNLDTSLKTETELGKTKQLPHKTDLQI